MRERPPRGDRHFSSVLSVFGLAVLSEFRRIAALGRLEPYDRARRRSNRGYHLYATMPQETETRGIIDESDKMVR